MHVLKLMSTAIYLKIFSVYDDLVTITVLPTKNTKIYFIACDYSEFNRN